ncbi:aminotransferase-like domain-containing protein [Microbacterium sp. RD1]|uniref:aminotransferase-like domain-containing protein n=1 Tax=Microbacterium sp. RD1 TaxID=3457313 RepID=UPI003FA5C698
MNTTVVDAWTQRVTARTATGIAAELAALVREGALADGERLPTIREVADRLQVSVGTVADAWASLREQKLIETRRRGGTRVIAASAPVFRGWSTVDFLLASPDVSLQPSLEKALAAGLTRPGVNAWGREHMVGDLRAAVEASWPFPAQAWLTAGGGTEGLWLATRAVVRPHRPVAVEEPAPPGYLTLVREMGAEVIGLPVDDEGPDPAALRAAVARGAGAVVLQPGGPFSSRSVLSAARRRELIAVLTGTDVAIVEDDSLGPLSSVPVRTLGDALPDQTLRVLSFCKAYGLDLRTSVVGGARDLVDRAIAARSGGIGSNSRILQHALAVLLEDADAASHVARARTHYATRRSLALREFANARLVARAGEGSMVLWVDVPDERAAVLALAARGIVVEGGSAAYASPPAQPVIRLSIAQLPEETSLVAELAATVARAVAGDLRLVFD